VVDKTGSNLFIEATALFADKRQWRQAVMATSSNGNTHDTMTL
jgi:hypothetical protein